MWRIKVHWHILHVMPNQANSMSIYREGIEITEFHRYICMDTALTCIKDEKSTIWTRFYYTYLKIMYL